MCLDLWRRGNTPSSPPGGVEPSRAGHRHPQEGAEEVIHQRIRLHHLPGQPFPCEESKSSSKKLRHLRLERWSGTISRCPRQHDSPHRAHQILTQGIRLHGIPTGGTTRHELKSPITQINELAPK